jgi:hypothetical protein
LAIPAVGAIGAWSLLAGVAVVWLACDDWRLAHEAAAEPQEIALRDLLENGYGANRHVHLTGIRFCDKKAEERTSKIGDSSLVYSWAPVVPADEAKERAAPAVPQKALVVLREVDFRSDDLSRRLRLFGELERDIRRGKEQKGYTGVVVTGLQKLPPKAATSLRELAPETDFASLLIIRDDVEPVPVSKVKQQLALGGVGIGAGLLVLGLACFWGRSVRRSRAVAAV